MNLIRTLGDYSKPSHEGYRNTIELPVGNNVVPPRSNTIRLVQNGCSFHGLRTEDLNQHLKDFLKLITGKERACALLEDLALYDNESWNNPKDFAKPVKAISLPQDIPSTSDRRLIELENQVQRLMEAHLAPMQPTQVNKITSSCKICSGPYDTQYCMENPKPLLIMHPLVLMKREDLYLNLSVLEVLAHAPIYNTMLDKYVESFELGKNGSAFIQGEVSAKMEDPGLFTLPCRLEDSKPFDTLADLGS
ncbi:hypothetical protein Tco_0722507 [Tanacetum coccineum]